MSFEPVGSLVSQVMANLAQTIADNERQHREIIRDEALAHIIIEDALEQQQIDGASIDAFERVQREVTARLWDNLTERDMAWWPHG